MNFLRGMMSKKRDDAAPSAPDLPGMTRETLQKDLASGDFDSDFLKRPETAAAALSSAGDVESPEDYTPPAVHDDFEAAARTGRAEAAAPAETPAEASAEASGAAEAPAPAPAAEPAVSRAGIGAVFGDDEDDFEAEDRRLAELEAEAFEEDLDDLDDLDDDDDEDDETFTADAAAADGMAAPEADEDPTLGDPAPAGLVGSLDGDQFDDDPEDGFEEEAALREKAALVAEIREAMGAVSHLRVEEERADAVRKTPRAAKSWADDEVFGRRALARGRLGSEADNADRLLEETNSKMAEDEGSRRRMAMAHLKAAAAATKRDRVLKDATGKSLATDPNEQSAYRADLARAVRGSDDDPHPARPAPAPARAGGTRLVAAPDLIANPEDDRPPADEETSDMTTPEDSSEPTGNAYDTEDVRQSSGPSLWGRATIARPMPEQPSPRVEEPVMREARMDDEGDWDREDAWDDEDWSLDEPAGAEAEAAAEPDADPVGDDPEAISDGVAPTRPKIRVRAVARPTDSSRADAIRARVQAFDTADQAATREAFRTDLRPVTSPPFSHTAVTSVGEEQSEAPEPMIETTPAPETEAPAAPTAAAEETTAMSEPEFPPAAPAERPYSSTHGEAVTTGPAPEAEAPEAEEAQAGMVEVPPPAQGRAGRRAGRVKTRLLGFQSQTAKDPFAEGSTDTAPQTDARFPVGWIIVETGPGRGAFFTLFSGVAKIGRGEDQTIRLDFGDNSISRDNHAAIAYDDEQNKFFLGHGGKSNLVRLNGMPVLSTESLSDGDAIRIGETTLRFIALCGEDFGWGGKDNGDDHGNAAIA